MATIKYIGRTTDFRGKTLWEIVGNLKNYGVGRIVVRSMFERYPEPSYMKILKVEAAPNATRTEEIRKVKVLVERTFRGRTYPKPVEIYSASYKADYRLIPKIEETNYCKKTEKLNEKILPQTLDFPPLLKQFLVDETAEPNPKMKLKVNTTNHKLYRIANDGEVPNVEIPMGLGKPVSAKLYENCF